ncbi:MAG: c-type cytochrome [Gammaproteobacteria bacterium]|nr:c-type cytochrome [Gammaproteobacteria bacterium]
MSSENNSIRNLYVGLSVLCLLAALLYLLSSLFNVVDNARNDEGVAEHFAASTNERIKPVSEVNVGDVNVVVVRSAKEIVEGTCMSCHGTGAMGAPKVGTKAQWKSRLSAGMKTMMKNATEGKGMMPARGGDASLSDADIKKAIKYMLKNSGL